MLKKMNKKRQNNLMKITALLIMQIFIFASVGFCLSPEILFDSKLVQIAFEQSNIEDKVLSIELPEWSEYTVELIDEHPDLKNQ